MNRIYQGKVTAVQVADGKDELGKIKWKACDGWQPLLWRHHELFHDAVNYYIVCLLALAQPGNHVYAIREKLDAHDEAGNPDELMVWRPFRRRGITRRGLRDFVAKYLTPGNDQPTPEECFVAVLAGSDVSADLRNLALEELLFVCRGDNPIKTQGKWMFDRFCKPAYSGGFPFDAAKDLRAAGEARLQSELHTLRTETEFREFADQLCIGWVVAETKNAKPFVGEEARDRLLKAVCHFRQAFGEKAETGMSGRVSSFLTTRSDADSNLREIADRIRAMPADELPTLPRNNRSIPDRLEAAILFKTFPRAFTADLLKVSFPATKLSLAVKPKDTDSEPPAVQFTRFGGDAIELARGQRGYIFRAFTSLKIWNASGTPTPQWPSFDVHAFKEALKTLHQIDVKAEDRERERKCKQAQLDYQRGKTKKWKPCDEGEEKIQPPILVGDPRIARLEQLVDEDLKDEYEMSEGVLVRYGLHQRTIRGFRDVRKRWNEIVKPEDQYSPDLREKLQKLLTEYKRENAQTMGSPAIFDAMVEEKNWIIWREPTAEQLSQWRKATKLPEDAEFAKDPLQALTGERELIEEIERLKGPIRFTPADPIHSRRQFYFSDVTDLSARDRLCHDRQTVDVEIADKGAEGLWHRSEARLHFAAPRLLRDQLNNTDGKDAAFQQAMMAALGLSADLKKTRKGKVHKASFAECAAVALMPEVKSNGEQRFLLNFPITLEDNAVARQLGKAARWDDKQFGGADKKSYWLRWPATWLDEKKERKKALPTPWWKTPKPFSCLSVDLGQRDAAAFAIIEATPGEPSKPRTSRKLGEAEGRTWWATVRATGILRLPGEDALVRRKRTKLDEDTKPLLEELSGERGRLATAEEWQEARDICERLGLAPDKILGADSKRHSFPELNDQLLFALRRAQARLARLQSWSCIESNPKRREAIVKQLKTAVEELKETQDGQERDVLLLELKLFIERDEWRLVAERLVQEVERVRALLPRELERIADRIQPLRGRRWEWSLRDGTNFILRQTERGTDNRKKLLAGQRGLSIERIEQLESLRQRCQSLNRALRQTPGQPANLGKSKRGIELPDPCPELLERLNALKEQRVNQTAHLILAQALGVRLRSHQVDDATRAALDMHGEYERIPDKRSSTGFHEPVDFIVLEHLDRYLARQGRSRAENSRLMTWCHRQILGKLKQLCEPYGLRVLETPPAYSSLFCSLTGVAGFRAVELTPDHATEYPWNKHLDRLREADAGKRTLSEGERRESERVRTLFRQLDEINQGVREANPKRPKWRTVLAPMTGGPIFVPASDTERFERENTKTGKMEPAIHFKEIEGRRPTIIQSDINAAINHGLRALAAPDVGDIHLRIRAKRDSESFIVRAENRREEARWNAKPPEIHVPSEKHRKKLLVDARLNFFADVGNVAEYDHAEIEGNRGFASGRGIWGTIKGSNWQTGKEWQRVEEINAARVDKWKRMQLEDDVPM